MFGAVGNSHDVSCARPEVVDWGNEALRPSASMPDSGGHLLYQPASSASPSLSKVSKPGRKVCMGPCCLLRSMIKPLFTSCKLDNPYASLLGYEVFLQPSRLRELILVLLQPWVVMPEGFYLYTGALSMLSR